MNDRSGTTPWWGVFEVGEGEVRRWEIGPTTLWIGRFDHEWRLAHHQLDDPVLDRQAVDVAASVDEIADDASQVRFGFRDTGGRVRIEPLLADRAVVLRPEVPFRVLSGEEVTLYVSTPAWVRVAVGDAGPMMLELPSYRPSDTWFGASTIDGEICYASRTTGRLDLDEVLHRGHRVITPIRLENRASDALEFDRLKLPVEYLELYEGPTTLWTPAVTLVREQSGDLAGLRHRSAPPEEAEDARRIAGARSTSDENLVVRAFSRIFGSE